MRAGIALGSNLGDRLANLVAARASISEIPGVGKPIVASPIYETEPVGCEPGAQAFLNAVIEVSYAGAPLELLEQLRQTEIRLGRPAEHQRNVSRTIDIDLLYFGDAVINTDRLTLPHPRLGTRQFVLQPLKDIQPDRIIPGAGGTVSQLLALVPQSAKVVRSALQW